jgi:hypothetical protein
MTVSENPAPAGSAKAIASQTRHVIAQPRLPATASATGVSPEMSSKV